MLKETNISYENGRFWVLRDKRGYHVMIAGSTHSVSDSSYADQSLAIARANYLAKVRTK